MAQQKQAKSQSQTFSRTSASGEEVFEKWKRAGFEYHVAREMGVYTNLGHD